MHAGGGHGNPMKSGSRYGQGLESTAPSMHPQKHLEIHRKLGGGGPRV